MYQFLVFRCLLDLFIVLRLFIDSFSFNSRYKNFYITPGIFHASYQFLDSTIVLINTRPELQEVIVVYGPNLPRSCKEGD